MSADGQRPSLGQLTWLGKRLKEALDEGEPPPPAGALRRDLQRCVNADSDVMRLPAVQEVLALLLYDDLDPEEWPTLLGQVIEQVREVYRQLRRPHPLDHLLMDVDWLWPTDRPALRALGMLTVGDLLQHYPRRYEDTTTYTPISDLAQGETARILGRVVWLKQISSARPLLRGVVRDDTGDLDVQFFNDLPRIADRLKPGVQVVLTGKVKGTPKRALMQHPVYELYEGNGSSLHVDRLLPIYPLTVGMKARRMREIVHCALEQCCPQFMIRCLTPCAEPTA